MKRVIKSSSQPKYKLTDADKSWLQSQMESMCDQCYDNYRDDPDLLDIVMEHMEEVVLDPEYILDHEQSQGLADLAAANDSDLVDYINTIVSKHIQTYFEY